MSGFGTPTSIPGSLLKTSCVLTRLYAVIEQVLGKELALAPETELLSAGIDSLGIVRVVLQCEELFGIEFEPEDLVTSKLTTPLAIATLLQEKYAVGQPVAD